MRTNAVSIVIVSYKNKDVIEACLRSVLAERNSSLDEVVLVDNQSEDGTVEAVQAAFPEVAIIPSGGNLGFAKACNLGASRTEGEFILFMNADVRLKAGSLSLLREKMKMDDSLAALTGEMVGSDGNVGQMSWGWDSRMGTEFLMKMLSPSRIAKGGWAKSMAFYLQRMERPVPFVTGACMLNRRQAFDRVGGWDPQFELYFEDGDLCRRYREAGYKVFFYPAVKVEHDLGGSGASAPLKISLVYRQSQLLYYRKHNSAVQQFMLKAYLWLKFPLSAAFWSQASFRRKIIQILRGKVFFRLSENLG